MRRGKQPKSLSDLLSSYDWDKKKYISQEWQDYAYRLAVFLDDLAHKSLYMRREEYSPAGFGKSQKLCDRCLPGEK